MIAEAIADRVFAGDGLGKRVCRSVDRRMWQMRVAAYDGPRRGTGRDSVPKTEMEEPTLRALATERLAERGASPDTATDRRQLHKEFAKGELSSLIDPFRRCTTKAAPHRADTWRAEGSARRLSYDAIKFSCYQGCFPDLISTFAGSDGPKLSASNPRWPESNGLQTRYLRMIGDRGIPRSRHGWAQYEKATSVTTD